MAGLIVVGAGPAGVAAAVQGRRLGLSVRLLDRSGRAGGLLENAHLVENYPGLEAPLPGPRLAERMAEHLARFEVRVEQVEVSAISRGAEAYALASTAGPLRARAVILAVGTEPAALGVQGEAHAFYAVRALLRALPAPGRVLVVGGGEAACDCALTLAAAGARVELLVRGEALRARGRLAGAVADCPSVRLRFGARLLGLQDGRVVRVFDPAAGTLTEEADAVLIAVGRRSAAPRLGGAEAPGLFLVGDARTGGLGQCGIAVGEGLAAAMAAAQFLEDA